MVDYISEFPFSDFVIDTLETELWELDKYVSNPPAVKLTDIEGYAEKETVAARLINAFNSLPWTYQLTFALPKQLSYIRAMMNSSSLPT
jgi:hypothetical protein